MPRVQDRILVVDDEFLVAYGLAAMVRQCGCAVVGPVANVAEGLSAIRQNVLDGAVLDINLGEERVWPIADLLQERGLPFVFASGYGRSDVKKRFRHVPLLCKPLSVPDIARALRSVGSLRH